MRKSPAQNSIVYFRLRLFETAHNVTEKYFMSRKRIGNGVGRLDPLITRTSF